RPPAVPRPSVVRPACVEPAAGLSGPGPACPVPGRYRREQRGGCRGRPAARPPLRDRWVYGWTLRAADRRPPRAPRSRGGGGGARPRRSPTPVDLGVIDRSRPRTRTGERCRTGRYINGLVAPPAAVTAAPGRTTGDAGPAAGHFGRPTGCPAVCEGPGAAGPYPRSAASATRRAPPGEAVPRVRAGAPPKAGGPGTPVPPGL